MKTAMQELIEWCNSCLTDKTMSDGGRIALEVTIVRATDLLEKEKEQIIDAYENGVGDENERNLSGKFTNAEEYYNQTFNQDRITISETKRSVEGIGLLKENKKS
jgi:hypothetical protein